MSKKDEERAKDQAKAQFESIAEMVENYNKAETDSEREDAEQFIFEDPLSIEVRSDWHSPGSDDGNKPGEYNILLCTGGPAVRIVGNLDDYAQPETAHLEYQDWFTPWVEYRLTSDEVKTLLEYAQHFYFGE